MAEKRSGEKWWQKPLTVALIAFVGSALGASIPRFWFSAEENEKRLLDSRIGAYNDFFKGQAKLQEANELRDQGSGEDAKKADAEYSSLIKSARFRIAVYGTKAEVTAIVNYFARFDVPDCAGTREKWRDDARIYQEVRTSFFRGDSSQTVDDDVMIMLLFSCKAP